MQYLGFDRPSFGIKTLGFGSSEFSPLDLFAGGKQGVWYDPSDKPTLFQDVEGIVPVTKDGDPVALMRDKSGNNNHATQSVSASRPVYKTDGNLHWLEFDGVDDYLLTTLAQVMRPLSIAFAKDEGVSPNSTATYMTFNSGGSILKRYASNYYMMTFGAASTGAERHVDAPTKNVLSLIINGDNSAIRFDNTVYPKVLGTNSLDGLMSIFSEIDGASSVKGRMYSFTISQAINRNDMDRLHTYLSTKSGVTL